MNVQQRLAVKYHCRFGFESARRKLFCLAAGSKASVGLSVNTGYE